MTECELLRGWEEWLYQKEEHQKPLQKIVGDTLNYRYQAWLHAQTVVK